MQALVRSALSDGYADHNIKTPSAWSTIIVQVAAAAAFVADYVLAAAIVAGLAGTAVGLNHPAFRGCRLLLFPPPRSP